MRYEHSNWCDRRDLNPYPYRTRPSNVRVCQFRHDRVLRFCNDRYYIRYWVCLSSQFSLFFKKIIRGIFDAICRSDLLAFLLTSTKTHAMISDVVWTSRMHLRRGSCCRGVRGSSLCRDAVPLSREEEMCPLRAWRNGRRARLRIWCPRGVWVQVPSPAPFSGSSGVECAVVAQW